MWGQNVTQSERILRHMRDFGSITTWDAFVDYGCARLSARIKDLRDAGHGIQADWESRKNRYGETVNYKRYRLVEPCAGEDVKSGGLSARSAGHG